MSSNPRICILTDEIIAQYSRNNVLTNYRDINLKILNKLDPYQFGVYDQDIFGSMFSDRCNCGNTRTPNIRCPRCGSTLLPEDESYKRFGRIELPILYSTKYKIDKIIKFLKANFKIVKRLETPEFKDLAWNDPKCLDILQWEWDEKDEALVVTDKIDDFQKCSYEGILGILQTHFPDLLTEFRAYLNQYVLVIPMPLRPPSVKMVNKNRVLENHTISVIYQNIIYCVHEYYRDTFPTMKSELGKALLRGSLRKLVSSSLESLSALMASSKSNLARSMQSNRLSNSGRCTIVPDPTLQADEVTIPFHLMYEACRKEFIQYLSEKKEVSLKEAEYIYKSQSDMEEVQKLFEQYVEGEPGKPETAKYVIINRAPSLYELSMFACRVKLTHDFAMKIPHVLCKPTNGDFDGDTFSYYAIPKEMNVMMNDALSARNRFLYKKNHQPLFTPTQEVMQGLTLGTRVTIPDKLERFDSLADAREYKKNTPGFKYQTLCVINNKETTIARAILSDLFDKDVDAYVGGVKGCLTAKNVTMLYEQLRDHDDRLTRIQKIQEFAVLISTISGATAVSMSDLYLEIDESYLKRIRDIENDQKIDQRAKELKIREIYKEYQSAMLSKVPDDVRVVIESSAHAKVSELRDMAVQQLNVGPDRSYSVAETTLAQGLSPYDYQWHAIENRSTQDIKQLAVPQSGYVTRQFTYLASEYYFKDGSDENNKGIFMPASKAKGRTTVDGKLVGETKSDDPIKVRSLITSTLEEGVITGDMLTNQFEYKVGSKIGMSLISSLTESLTQSGLALKHGGNLFNLNPEECIKAPESGVVHLDDISITLKADSGKVYTWPRNFDFVLNYISGTNHYKSGEVIGKNYHSVTPSYRLDSIIKLCSARSTNSKKRFGNNYKLVSECYALEDGVIRYEVQDGLTKVFINDTEYNYNPDCMYYFASGTKVKKYDRICNGTLDMKSMVNKITDYIELFYFFRKQFEELMPVSPELIEFMYVLLIKDKNDHLEMKSVLQNIHGSDSFFKSLAFGDARKSFQKIDYEGMDFVADPITAVMLSLVMTNEIK